MRENGTKEGLKELQMNNADAKEELVDAFVNHSGELIDWLSDMGIQFRVDIQNDQRNQSSTQSINKLLHVTDGR